jgi:hypothetical protein
MIDPLYRQRTLNVISGLVLSSAATLKVLGLQSGDSGLQQLLPVPAWAIYLLSANEALLGLWLIFGRPSVFQRRVTLVVFLAFTAVSLKLLSDGSRTCGCFGAVAVSPWYTLCFDISVVVATVMFGIQNRQAHGAGKSRRWFVANVSLAVVTIASTVLLVAVADAHYRARFSRTALQIADDIRSLVPNLPLIFSQTGVAPAVIPKPTEPETVEEFLRAVAKANGQHPFLIQAVSSGRVVGFTQGQSSELPYVVQTSDGRILMLLGLFDDGGTDFWQVLESGAPPSLVMKTAVDDRVTSAWRIPLVAAVDVQQDVAMSLDRLHENFGLIQRRESRETQFVITNTSNSAVALEAPTVSCHCIVAAFANKPPILQPGDKATVFLKAAIGTRNLRQTVRVSGVMIDNNRRLPPVSFEVLGSQLQLYSLSPGRLDFGTLRSEQTTRRVVRLSELRHDQIHTVKVHTDLPISWSVQRKQRPNGLHDFLIELNLDATQLASGKIDGRIRLDTDNKRASDLTVSVKGFVPPKFSVTPSTLAFGSLGINERVERHAQLRVPAGQQWEILHTEPDEGFEVSIAAKDEGLFDVSVAYLAERPGTTSSLIDLTISSGKLTESVQLHCVAKVHP